MKKDPAHKKLRKTAERIVGGEPAVLTEEEQLDLLRLAQELEIAHVQLAAQNEQLRQLSRELEASRDEFVGLYESMPLGFVSLSPKGIVLRANARARQLFAGGTDTMVGSPFSNYVVPEDLPRYFEHREGADREGRFAAFELRLRGAKGRLLNARMHARWHYGPEGALRRWDLAVIEVTEQKQLEAALEKSREHLELATRAGEVGIWIYDLGENESHWNAQLYRMLGLEPRKGPENGDFFFTFIHPEDREGALENLQSLLASTDELVDLEFRVVKTDGRVRWLAARGRIARDEDGRAVEVHGVNLDITDNKQNELALQESRERFQTVLEHSLDVAFRRNLQTQQYDYLSPVIEQITGFSANEVIEMNNDELLSLVHPEDRTRAAAGMEAAFRTGSGKLKFRFCKKNGGYLWMADHFTIQKDARGRPIYRTGVMRDITDQWDAEKELEEKTQKLSAKLFELEHTNRELSDYAYAVSHDLKAPLRAVRNYADFLIEDLEEKLTGEQRTYLAGMKKAISQGDELIRDLLNFSRIGQVLDAPEKIDLAELVREVCEMLSLPEAVQVSVPRDCPALVARRSMLRQILLNLIDNAVKFNDSDVKKVEVWCRPGLRQWIELLVKDNGIGIGERYQEKIFRVFQRLHSGRQYEGTGIGLAIVRKAAAHLGGTVRVESAQGRGSMFIVTLPETQPEPDDDAAAEKEETAKQ